MPYPINLPPFYSTSATIPAPLSSHSFNHGYTTSSPNPYPSSTNYSNPYSSYYTHAQQPPLPYSQPQPPPLYSPPLPYHSTDTPPPNPIEAAILALTAKLDPMAGQIASLKTQHSSPSKPPTPESHTFTGRNGLLRAPELSFAQRLVVSPPPKPPDRSFQRGDSTMPPPSFDSIPLKEPDLESLEPTFTASDASVEQIALAESLVRHGSPNKSEVMITPLITEGHDSQERMRTISTTTGDNKFPNPVLRPPPPKPPYANASIAPLPKPPSDSISRDAFKDSPPWDPQRTSHALPGQYHEQQSCDQTINPCSLPPNPCFARGDSTITPPPLKPPASELFTGSNGMHPNERFPRSEGAAAVDSPEEVEDAAEQNPTYTGSVTVTKSSHEAHGLADPVTNPMAETILNPVSVVAQPAIRQKGISPMLPAPRHYNRLLFPSAKFQDVSLSLEQRWSSHDPYAPQSRDNVSFPSAFPAVSHLSTRSRPAPSDQKRVFTDQSRPFTVGSIRVASASTNQSAARFPPWVKKKFGAFDRSANAMDQLVRGSRSMGFIKNLGLDTGWAKSMHDVFFKQWDPGKFILWANFYNLEDKVGLHGVWNVRITGSGLNANTDPNTTTTSAHPRRIIQQPTYLQGFVWKPRMTKVLEYHSSALLIIFSIETVAKSVSIFPLDLHIL